MAYRALLRTERLRALCDAQGYSVTRFADDLGVDRSTAYRVLRGETLPSNGFIAGCAVVFGENAIPELFRFAHEDEDADGGKTFAPVMRRRETALINTDAELAAAARGGTP